MAARSQHLITSSNLTRQMASRPPLNYFMPDWIITGVICWIIARTKGDKTRFVLQVCLCARDQRRDTCRCASHFVKGDRDHRRDQIFFRVGGGVDRTVISARKNIIYTNLYFLLPQNHNRYRTLADVETVGSQQPSWGNHKTRLI